MAYAICPQSEYWEQWASVQLREMIEGYDPDGIWVDGDWPGPCYCPRCQARFRATYGGVFHFSYTVPLTLQPHDAGWELSGEANLGKLAGGAYYYEGRITPTNFTSTYRSKYDHGIFELHRPE